MREIGGGDHDAPGAFAVGRAGLIVRGRRRLEIRYGLDGDRRAGDVAEQIRKLGLHLRNVLAEVLENLLGGGRDVLGIGFQRLAERGQIRKSQAFGDGEHLGLDAFDLAQSDLVNLIAGLRLLTVVRLRMSLR